MQFCINSVNFLVQKLSRNYELQDEALVKGFALKHKSVKSKAMPSIASDEIKCQFKLQCIQQTIFSWLN